MKRDEATLVPTKPVISTDEARLKVKRNWLKNQKETK